MTFKLYKPSGFIAQRERVIIYDLESLLNTPFYDFDFTDRDDLDSRRFNLPIGEYETENDLIQSYFKPSKHINLPPPEVKRELAFNYPIIYGVNKNKASIFFDKKIILIDSSFKNLPKYCYRFVINHEYGHSIYKKEINADLYAMIRMLKEGFNKSQIRNAINMSLTKPHSIIRKKIMNFQTSKASIK
jgi:hypothetical protein